jgi:hypothetical protein
LQIAGIREQDLEKLQRAKERMTTAVEMGRGCRSGNLLRGFEVSALTTVEAY